MSKHTIYIASAQTQQLILFWTNGVVSLAQGNTYKLNIQYILFP